MKILKTKTFFTYLVVGALVMALSISCKSNEEPSSGPKAGTKPPAGEYSSISYINNNINNPYTNKATVTHNGNGCTISGTLLGNKQLTSSTYEYKTNSFNITVNSWYENSDGNGSYAQGEQITLDKGSIGNISWNSTDSGNAAIVFGISAADGFFYNSMGGGRSVGLTN